MRLFFYFTLLLFSPAALCQLPAIQWAKNYGGSQVDIPLTIKPTIDGGTIAAGFTDSKDGDVGSHANRDYWDLWVVKLDKCGNIQWQQSFGGTNYEAAHDVVQTADGSFIVVGETNSTNGGVVPGYGGTKDIWILKLSSAGNLIWQKRYGGTGLDIANSIKPMPDGNYLIAATTSSNDGDIKQNHSGGGFTDGLLMKMDANGTILWSKCFGGSKNDELFSVEIIDNFIYAAGYANSTDGDIPPSQKNYDVWLLALDANLNKVYSKIYGGSQNDVAYSMTKGTDGTLTLAGYTTSNDGDVSGSKGSQDYWILNVSTNGKLNWQKALGGTQADYASTIITDKDGGYVAGGIAYSNDGDVINAKDNGDYWVVKLDAKGNVTWKKNYGGSETDYMRSLCYISSTDEYYLAGDSQSSDGDITGNTYGDADFWIIKLKEPKLIMKDSTVCQVTGFVSPTDTVKDICGYDSLIVNYKPVALNNPFAGISKADTIFEGDTIVLPYTGNGSPVWQADPTLSCTDCKNPVASPKNTTTYKVTNSLPENCSVTDYFKVVVLKDAVINIPNAFTPNGDGLNDLFGPLGKVPEGYSLKIYNHYGELVFQSHSIDEKWDGTFRGRAQLQGVFVYYVTYRDTKNKLQLKKGTVALLR